MAASMHARPAAVLDQDQPLGPPGYPPSAVPPGAESNSQALAVADAVAMLDAYRFLAEFIATVEPGRRARRGPRAAPAEVMNPS